MMDVAIPPPDSDDLRLEVQDVLNSVRFHEDDQAWISESLASAAASYNADVHGHCIHSFLVAELATSGTDTAIPRERGTSQGAPRFGAYFSNKLSGVERVGVFLIASLMRSCILRGYICRVILEPEDERPLPVPVDELLRQWIDAVYTNDPTEESEQQAGLIWNCCEELFLKLKALLDKYDLRGGGLLARDKTPLILSYYPHAGYWLRIVETNSTPE